MKTEKFSPFVQSDAEKCIGCRSCEIACAVAHAPAKVNTAGATEGIFMPRLFVMVAPEMAAPVQCHHCEDAPCRAFVLVIGDIEEVLDDRDFRAVCDFGSHDEFDRLVKRNP